MTIREKVKVSDAARAPSCRTDDAAGRRSPSYLVGVLFAVNVVAYLDRQVMTLMFQPIKSSLRLSDGEVGLLQGLAFVATFTIGGLFLGRLVDRCDRSGVLLACMALWSVSAAAGGLARTGWELAVSRMGVGLGESVLIPCVVSMLADHVKASRRGGAYGVFTTGIYAGSGGALALVAAVLPSVDRLCGALSAVGLDVEPWRVIMAGTILPGLGCCALLLTVPEPARSKPPTVAPPRRGLGAWRAGWRVYALHHSALGFANFGLYAVTAWMPSVLVRQFHMPMVEAGYKFGAIVAICGAFGAYLVGRLSDIASDSGGPAGRMRVAAGAMAVGCAGAPMIAAIYPSAALAGAALVIGGLGGAFVAGMTALGDVSPPRSRGTVVAICFVFTGVIGTAGGPGLVGILSDRTGHLAPVLAASCAVMSLVAVCCAAYAARLMGQAALDRLGSPGDS